MQGKDNFIDVFQSWLSQTEAKRRYLMIILRTDDGKKFICHKFQAFREKKGILIKYVTLYMHEENRLAKQGWCTIVTRKDLMLINNGLPNGFWIKVIEIINYLQNKLPIRSRTYSEMIPGEA